MRHLVCRVLFEKQKFPKSRSSVKAVRLKHNLAASPILSDIPATSSRIELESSGTAGVGAKDDSPLTSSLPSLSAVAHEHLRPRRLSPFGVECLSRGRTPSSAARRIGHLEMAGKASDKAKLQQGFGHPQAGLPSRFEWVFTAASPPTNSRPSPCKPVPCDNTPLGGWTIAMQVRKVGSGAARRQSRGKLLEAPCRREIDGVLFWRLDRGGSVTDLPHSKAASPQSHSYLSA